MQETRGPPLVRGDALEEEMATHSRILAWRTAWTEEPGGLQSMGSRTVGHDWATHTHTMGRSSTQEQWLLTINVLNWCAQEGKNPDSVLGRHSRASLVPRTLQGLWHPASWETCRLLSARLSSGPLPQWQQSLLLIRFSRFQKRDVFLARISLEAFIDITASKLRITWRAEWRTDHFRLVRTHRLDIWTCQNTRVSTNRPCLDG